jgi:hypothetical protein
MSCRGKDPVIGMLDFSPDGTNLIACERSIQDAVIHLLDSANGKALREPIIYKYKQPAIQTSPTLPTFPTAQISPGGLLLAASFDSPITDIWEMATMRKAFGIAGYRDCTNIVFRSATQLITTGGSDEVCLWDLAMTPPFRHFGETTAKRKESAWDALKSLDAMYGVAATEYFIGNPKEFLESARDNQLVPPLPPQERMEALIKDLNHSVYLNREKAKAELVAYGEVAEIGLQGALMKNISLEARNRIKDILSRIPKADGLGSDAHRQLRAIFILQRIGTPECLAILERVERTALDRTVLSRAKEAALRLSQKR